MSAKDMALEMLAQGLQPPVVAATIGVTESYISQLLSDEDFAAAVAEKRSLQSQADMQYDDKLARVEEVYLDRIEQKAGMANLQQSMQAFKIINGAKRKKDRSAQPLTQNIGVVVNIALPTIVAPQYLLNQNSEIVEVEGKTMISASPKSLDGMVAARKPVQQPQLAEKLETAQTERALVTLENVRPVARRQKRDSFSVDML